MTTLALRLRDSGIVPPPAGLSVDATTGSIVLAGTVALIIFAVAYGVWSTRQSGSPRFFLVMAGAITIFPFVIEPIGDVLGATFYPADGQPIAATLLAHPIPWFIVLLYGGGMPVAVDLVIRLVESGASLRKLALFCAGAGAADIALELVLVHVGVMVYHDNHALVLGMPLTSMVQNGAMYAVIAFAFAAVLPYIRGALWLAVPAIAPMSFAAWAIICTLPSYFAIHSGWSPAVTWSLAIVSIALNGGVALAAAYSPTLARLRAAPTAIEKPVPLTEARV